MKYGIRIISKSWFASDQWIFFADNRIELDSYKDADELLLFLLQTNPKWILDIQEIKD